MQEAKPYSISKKAVIAAYQKVKANKGTYGVDEQSIEDFEKKLNNNLYKIWNRMSSGTYFPQPVKAVAIPKKNGGTRILGIPTVEDRIAQMVAKLYFEPNVEPIFYEDSYGYRPNKSAIQALEVTRTRCWRKDWVLEFDIRGLFDNIRHDYLMEMVKRHTQEKWILLYIERWLRAPFQMEDGTIVERTSGTPQGGLCLTRHKPPCGTPLFGIPSPSISAFNIFPMIHITFLSLIPIAHNCFINLAWFTLSKNPLMSTSTTK